MNQLLKSTNINKYIIAIRVANAMRTATYAAVAVLSLLNIYKVYKTLAK